MKTRRSDFGLSFRPAYEQRRLMRDLTGPCESAADAAFTVIYDDYFAALVRKADGFLQDVAEYGVATTAEDIAQDALGKLWVSRRKMDSESTAIYAWLARVVTNLAMNELRDVRNRDTELLDTSPAAMAEEPAWNPESPAPTPDKMAERAELRAIIIDVASRVLSEKQFRAFVEYHLNERTTREVASELGMKVNSVKSALTIAHKRIREPLAARLDFMNLSET